MGRKEQKRSRMGRTGLWGLSELLCVQKMRSHTCEDVEFQKLPFPLSFVGLIAFSSPPSIPLCLLAAMKCLGGDSRRTVRKRWPLPTSTKAKASRTFPHTHIRSLNIC